MTSLSPSWKFSFSLRTILVCAMGMGCFTGCAAFHPVDGIPVQGVPAQYRGAPRTGMVPIDLSLLRQTRPAEYRVDAGDLLGVFIEGILGEPDQVPPVTIANNSESRPALGYPILIQDDGTISLPGFPDLYVRGMTLREVRERIRHAYTVENPLLQKGEDHNEAHILVNLQRKRTYRVMVIRQESENTINGSGAPGQIDLNVVRRGTGQVVQLPAYENDVLHALTQTGGLPSSAAENAVYILRRSPQVLQRAPATNSYPSPPMAPPSPAPLAAPAPAANYQYPNATPTISHVGHSTNSNYRGQMSSAPRRFPQPQPATVQPISIPNQARSPYGSYRLPPAPSQGTRGTQRTNTVIRGQSPQWDSPSQHATTMPGDMFWNDAGMDSPQIIRIPLRVYPGDVPSFSEADIILQEGDIVFVESRETEFFFTGGLLGGGQYVLPQNYDLGLLEALSIVQSQVNTSFNSSTRAVGGVSALNQDVTVGASKVIILRKAPNGCEIRIKVDLYDAIRDPNERIRIQPGDYVLLQYTRCEAVAAFFERYILEGAVVGAASSVVFGGNN